jgi:hypothetical protein
MKEQNHSEKGVLRQFRWGMLFASAYLLIAITCYALYRADRHEYSIPMFIFYYSSLPVYMLLAEVLKEIRGSFINPGYSELFLVSLVCLFTAAIYFIIGQAIGWLLRNIKGCLRKTRTQSEME